MPFGGAGPLFGTLLARELEIRRIVVPPVAGNFSAWGLLGADLVRRRRSRRGSCALDDAAIGTRERAARGAVRRARRAAGVDGEDGEREVGLDMRYVGQEHSLTVPIAGEDGRITADAAGIRATFHRRLRPDVRPHHGRAGRDRLAPGDGAHALPRRARGAPAPRRLGDGADGAPIEAWSFTRGERLPFALVDRASLAAGASLSGPAILLEETATTYLDAGWRAPTRTPPASLVHRREG